MDSFTFLLFKGHSCLRRVELNPKTTGLMNSITGSFLRVLFDEMDAAARQLTTRYVTTPVTWSVSGHIVLDQTSEDSRVKTVLFWSRYLR